MDSLMASGSPPTATDRVTPSWRRWAALAVLCTASFMVILDGAIVFVAVPSIASDLGLSAADVQWVASGYLLCFGALLLLGGRAADLLGRRRMFMVGNGLFVLSSLLCGLAWSGEVLIASRAVQGISAAIMMPTALSILMTTFEEGGERNKALGIWSAIGGIGGTAGVLIGGPVTDGLGWEWNFLINVPIGLAMLVLAPVLLRESSNRGLARRFDVVGAATITIALVLLVYAVVKAPEVGWLSAQTAGLIAASLVLMAMFIVIERRSAAPLLPLGLFRSRGLLGGNLMMLAIGLTVYGSNIIITLYIQQVLGYAAWQFGLMTVAMTVMAVIGSVLGQGVATRLGVRPLALVSMALMAAGALIFTRISADGSYFKDLFVPLVLLGLGLGAGFVAASIAALTGVAEEVSGIASGLSNIAFQLGGALGIAAVTTVAVTFTTTGPDRATALVDGFQAAYVADAVFAVLGLLAAYVLLRRPKSTETTETTGTALAVEGETAPATA
jgi:EmrB/QacA subfamily drug resistance transporter